MQSQPSSPTKKQQPSPTKFGNRDFLRERSKSRTSIGDKSMIDCESPIRVDFDMEEIVMEEPDFDKFTESNSEIIEITEEETSSESIEEPVVWMDLMKEMFGDFIVNLGKGIMVGE